MSDAKRYKAALVSQYSDVVLAVDHDAALAAKDARISELEIAVREFAGFFSSDDPRHWELHGLADNCTYGSAKEGEGHE